MPRRSAEIFRAFLAQGLTSFGGPVAHLGYFRREFVERRRWVDDAQFAQLLAMSQFLPGPASSQLGFSLGLLRGGWWGAVAAFVGFTLPSALLMFALASFGATATGPVATSVIHALKLMAAVVVLDGLWRMARALTPDLPRAAIAGLAALLVLLTGAAWSQLLAIALAGGLGALLLRPPPSVEAPAPPTARSRRAVLLLLALFALGLVAALSWPSREPSLAALAAAMYRAGALVFGGGHVVLPLLEDAVVGTQWVTREQFLAGYGAAQLLPGPMFAFTAYVGALAPTGAAHAMGALVALLAVFTPGFLLVGALLPSWSAMASHRAAMRAVAGINAAVVGLLAAALVDPVLPAALDDRWDLLAVALGLMLQATLRRPTFAVLAVTLAASLFL